MANTISALKRVRQTKRRTVVNRMRKTRLRHGLRELRRRIEAKDASGAAELLPGTFSIVDRAAKWGIIRQNTAARYKSRIAARLRALTPATA
ncbi:MAG: 30S ribosomal protein S20 [Bryobacteraceae bacterium]|jgi:small subunit ribosomal protein S20